MNERIQELAKQSGLVRCGDWGMKRWESLRSESITDLDLEKFAELIVKECMSYMEDGDIDFAKFMIKKQFGVEA